MEGLDKDRTLSRHQRPERPGAPGSREPREADGCSGANTEPASRAGGGRTGELWGSAPSAPLSCGETGAQGPATAPQVSQPEAAASPGSEALSGGRVPGASQPAEPLLLGAGLRDSPTSGAPTATGAPWPLRPAIPAGTWHPGGPCPSLPPPLGLGPRAPSARQESRVRKVPGRMPWEPAQGVWDPIPPVTRGASLEAPGVGTDGRSGEGSCCVPEGRERCKEPPLLNGLCFGA